MLFYPGKKAGQEFIWSCIFLVVSQKRKKTGFFSCDPCFYALEGPSSPENRKVMKYHLDESIPRCLECGDPLPYGGRGDRKFCCTSCKNRHHNREARQWRVRYARTIGILQKNHDILLHLVRMGIRSIPKSELVQLGYQPDFVTSCARVSRRLVCHCFDIVFHQTENRLTNLNMDTAPWLPGAGEE
jgi:hypothetical protein